MFYALIVIVSVIKNWDMSHGKLIAKVPFLENVKRTV